MRRLPVLLLPFIVALVSCISPEAEFPSSQCVGAVPAQFTRIYIGAPAPHGQQTGTSAEDPIDATTADKFDTILRTIADGERPTWGGQSQIGPENLVVCIGPGNFQTHGQYDPQTYDGPASGIRNVGFSVGKNWKIHGHGPKRTKLVLVGYMRGQFTDPSGNAFAGGINTAIGTHSPEASGVEVSDLTIDLNHDALYNLEKLPLNLNAVVLRSREGGHWIHKVNVVGASADLGAISILYESFPVWIWGDSPMGDFSVSRQNLIEKVSVTRPGRAVGADQVPGGPVSAIIVANAMGEVRDNFVQDYNVGYGGWAMGPVWFHDNVAKNTRYGFNADARSNVGVRLESNRIIHPSAYGIVMGGPSQNQVFSRWRVTNNTIEIDHPNVAGLVLRGQVQDSTFADNRIFSDQPAPRNVTGVWSFPSGAQSANFSNIFRNNQLDRSHRIDFSRDPFFNSNCRFQNRDAQNLALPDFPDNTTLSAGGCAVPGALP
jgi:copper-binding protein NosD